MHLVFLIDDNPAVALTFNQRQFCSFLQKRSCCWVWIALPLSGTSCWWRCRTGTRSCSTVCWRPTSRSSCPLFTLPLSAWLVSSMDWHSEDHGEINQSESSLMLAIFALVAYHFYVWLNFTILYKGLFSCSEAEATNTCTPDIAAHCLPVRVHFH